MTWTLDIEDEKVTKNHHRHLPYLRLAQVEYKRAIIHYDIAQILRTAVRVALPCMSIPRNERSPRDESIIRLVLYFLRNIAMIDQPQDLPAATDESEISRSAVIDAFYYQDIFQVLLTICSGMGDEYALQDVVLLEILFFVLKGIDPEKLFMEERQLNAVQNDHLKAMMQKEKALLSDYKRYAPSRHNRFGTMVWIKREDEKFSTVTGQASLHPEMSLRQMDRSKKWNKPKQRGNKQEDKKSTEFDKAIPLTSSARKHLRQFVEDFLDSSFNPLFAHLRKAIEREAERVLAVHSMQFWYLVSWFLQAECSRRRLAKQNREERSRAGEPALAKYEEESYGLIACVMNQESFILLNRYMQRTMDDKDWQELNAGMKCFTQILITVQEMANSPFEDDQEIAENIQNRIFYEESTHDRILSILRNYKDQGLGYLDTCTELAHVFIRMLEHYSKQNVDMQIRSRRRTRRKRKGADANATTDANVESETEDIQEAERITRERKFDFTRFAAKFVNQTCVNTFVSFLKFYNDLSQEQLKRAHRFFYRVAFKNELSTLLFRVDIIQLFHKMIKGPEGLNRELPIFKEWEEFIRQLFRRLIKRIPDRPGLVVEMLFTKIPATIYYLEHGHDKEVPTKKARPPAELELRPGVFKHDGIKALVALLSLDDRMDLLVWLKDTLEEAATERQAWEDQHFANRNATVPDKNSDIQAEEHSHVDESVKPPSISKSHNHFLKTIANNILVVKAQHLDIKRAMFKNGRLRLLMSLLGFERLGLDDDPNANWVIPSTISSAQLHLDYDSLEHTINEPQFSYDDDKVPEDFIRRKPLESAEEASQRLSAGAFDDDDSDGLDDSIELDLFPAGGPTTRKSDALDELKKRRRKRNGISNELDDEEKAKRAEMRRLAELEKRRKIKSDLYVHPSDDETDEEKDVEFFAQEEERRKKMSLQISHAISALSKASSGKGNKRKSSDDHHEKSKKKRKKTPGSGEECIVDSDEEDVIQISSDSSSDSDVEEEDSSTIEQEDPSPFSSEQVVPQDDLENESTNVLKPIAANMVTPLEQRESKGLDSEDEFPVVRSSRPRLRAGFVSESDSE